MDLRETVARELDAARQRSLGLLEPVPEDELVRQHSPLMSPLIWDLAHVGNYEDLWLLRALGQPGVGPQHDDTYNPFVHPRAERPALPMLGPREARSYVADVRGRALDLLERVDLDGAAGDRPLLHEAYVYGMVVQHEHQHDETMLATLQLRNGDPLLPVAPPPPEGVAPATAEVLVAGGPFVMGSDCEPWAYDNERPAHAVDLPPFWIDTAPVTNREYRDFVDAGGYRHPRYWSGRGWEWRMEASLEHPQFWQRAGDGGWARVRFGIVEDLPPDEPVQHVCWYEADAYARWRGKRLPTEAEWEKAASWDPAASGGRKRRFPWGDDAPSHAHANLGQQHYRPAPVGAYPAGTSPWGCVQMLGDVWEWTSTSFGGYPGFQSFPYREYSEVFYGDEYKVLRGGSWATHPLAVRTTFRNWDFPIRRQIFCGFRCARDA